MENNSFLPSSPLPQLPQFLEQLLTALLSPFLQLLLACTLAIVLVLLLRAPLRRLFGAGAVYQAWLLLPLAMLMSLLPSWTPAQQPALAGLPVVRIVKLAGATALSASAQGGWAPWLLLAWGAGALAACLLFVRAQQSLLRSLGPLTRRGELWLTAHASHGPLLLGLIHPRIVMPCDVEQRYNPVQLAMVIAHEQMHKRRGDPIVNVLLAALQCLFWFHPLVHLAVSRCRFDQELACDALVMAAFPSSVQRGAYARALLQTQLAGALAPASCHWQASHPLKERIMSLQQSSQSHLHHPTRRLAGRLLLAACAGLTGYGAIAAGAQAQGGRAGAQAGAAIYQLQVKIEADGATSTARMRAVAPGKFEIRSDPQGKAWSAAFVVTPAADGHVMIASTITRQGKIVGKPGLLTRLGDTGKVKASGDNHAENYSLELTVTEVDSLTPGA